MRKFYRKIEKATQTVASLNGDWFDRLEKQLTGTARLRLAKGADKEVSKDVSLINVSWNELPNGVDSIADIARFCDREFREIRKIRNTIDKDQESRREFLDELFRP